MSLLLLLPPPNSGNAATLTVRFSMAGAGALGVRASGVLTESFSMAAVAAPGVQASGAFVESFSMAAAAAAAGQAVGALVESFSMAAAAQTFAGVGAFRLSFHMAGIAHVTFPHVGPLAVTSVSPDSGGAFAFVDVFGTGFYGATRVAFGAAHADQPFSVLSDTHISALAPYSPYFLYTGNADPLTVDVQVYTLDEPAGSPLNPPGDQYTFEAPPVVTNVTPNIGSPSGTVSVVVTGKNLQGVFLVKFGLFDVGFGDISINADGTTAIVPLHLSGLAAGVYPFQIWNAAGFSAWHNPSFTVYSTPSPEPTPPALAGVLAGRFGVVSLRYRFEQRDWQNTLICDLTPFIHTRTFKMSVDNTQAVSATATFEFEGEGLPASLDEDTPETYNIAVFIDADAGGTTYTYQKGLFHLDSSTIIQYPGEFRQCQGSDLCWVLAERASHVAYSVPQNASYLAAINAICRQFGLRTNFPPFALVFTPISIPWPPDTPWIQIVNDLLLGIGWWPLWAQEDGALTSRPLIDPALEVAAVSYDSTTEPRMIAAVPSQRKRDVGQLKNVVSVAIDDPLRDPYAVQRSNNDPASPVSIVRLGKQNPLTLNGASSPSTKALANPATADALAEYLVRDEAVKAVTRTLETLPDPRRGHHETVALDFAGFESGLWRVRSWSLDLSQGPGGQMTHLLERVASIQVSGPPPAGSVIGEIGCAGRGSLTPFTELSITAQAATTPGNAIAIAIVADLAPVLCALTDSAGNVYPVVYALAGPFGIPTRTGGECRLLFGLCLGAKALKRGDTITLTGTGGDEFHQAALCAWELGGLSPVAFGYHPDAASSPSNTNTLSAVDSGEAGPSAAPYSLAIGAVGAVWDATAFDLGPDPGYAFTPDAGPGWTASSRVVTDATGGLFAALFLVLRQSLPSDPSDLVRISGTLSSPAAGWGAAALTLPSVQ